MSVFIGLTISALLAYFTVRQVFGFVKDIRAKRSKRVDNEKENPPQA